MALATRCPHCETAFRVASDQLKLRAGLVRCGTCNQIFNGIENLLHPDEDMPPALAPSALPQPEAPLLPPADGTLPAEAAVEKAPVAPNDAIPGHAAPPLQSQPPVDPAILAVSAADKEDAFLNADATGPRPAVLVARDGRITSKASSTADTHAGANIYPMANTDPGSEKAGPRQSLWMTQADVPLRPEPDAAQPGFDADTVQPACAEVVATEKPDQDATGVSDHAIDPVFGDDAQRPLAGVVSSPDTIPSMAGLLRAARVDDDAVLTRPSRMPVSQPSPKPVNEARPALELADLPDFVVRDQKKQGRYRAWQPVLWIACGILGVALILQSIYATRITLAANFPQTREVLDAACHWLGCSVGLPAQIESVSIESSDFQPVDGNGDLFLLTVLLRNRNTTVQGWPCIELTLNDAADRPLGRRVITPPEYLPAGQDNLKGIPAGAEQPVKLYFDLTQIKALGYRVYLFYP